MITLNPNQVSPCINLMSWEVMVNEKPWPSGLRVMVVESNSLYLFLIEQLLCQCDYKVTSCKEVQEAISFVLENQQNIDLIISDAFLPSEDGLLILETIALKFGIPVVIMSWNGETSTLMKFIAYGACDYLVKPVTLKELKNIWTHVFRKQIGDQMKYLLRSESNTTTTSTTTTTTMCSNRLKKRSCDFSSSSSIPNDDYNNDELVTDVRNLKKSRLHWTRQLHKQFVATVSMIGLDKAVPKNIMKIMNVEQLTREQVASHLQKYKIYMKRLQNSMHGDGVESSSSHETSLHHELKNKEKFRSSENSTAVLEDQSPFLSEVINELHAFDPSHYH